MNGVKIDDVEYRAVSTGARRVVCLVHGWTWIGEYSEEIREGGVWVRLRRACNVQRYARVGIGGVINSPDCDSVTLGAELSEDLVIPPHAVVWTAGVPE